MKNGQIFHGSDIERVARQYGLDPEKIINFSSNVSPMGISPRARQAICEHVDDITRYPDREYVSLRAAIGCYTGCQDADVVVGNGASELISLVVETCRPKRALIVGPCYSEYAHEVELHGGRPEVYLLSSERAFALDPADLRSHLTGDVDMLILCNPNNPTSSLIGIDRMREILHVCKERGIRVMVDETYIEFSDDPEGLTAIRHIQDYSNLVVIRGTSKFFAAPGLRLGYLVSGDQDLLQAIRDVQDPWAVGSLAEIGGRAMFCDREYIRAVRGAMRAERERIYRELLSWKRIEVFRPEANFVLIRLCPGAPDADAVFRACIEEGMMIRNCSSFPSLEDRYIRFCFLTREENDRLLHALRRVIERI